MRMIKEGCLLKKKVLRRPSFGIWEDEETLQVMNKVPPPPDVKSDCNVVLH